MSGDWKSGDVAMVTDDIAGPTVRIYGEYPSGMNARWYAGHGGFVRAENVTAVRPLVVIDPEDAEQVDRLLGLWANQEAPSYGRRSLVAALREFATPTPAKPDEPLGLGAVVKCDPGPVYDRAWAVRLWAGDTFPGAPWDWHDSSGNGGRRQYADLPVLSIFTEGVPATDLGG